MTLEQCDKFADLEGFWFLDVNKESFVVSTDLCIFVKPAVDASLDESIEGVN